jgi:hypothetical protein
MHWLLGNCEHAIQGSVRVGYVTTLWDDGEGEPFGLAEVLGDAEVGLPR